MNEFSNKFKKNYIRNSSESYLNLTLLPTEKCNFRCVYCYEDFKIGKMDRNVIKGIKKLLSKAAPTLKILQVSWFGGEPTLGANIVQEISKHIEILKNNYGFTFFSDMTTNAFLMDDTMFCDFLNLGVRSYQITLDGDERGHNKTRVLVNGKDTFNKIWDNLISYKQVEDDFSIKIRLHITKNNEESMLQLAHQLHAAFGADKRFSYFVREISNLGEGVNKDIQKHLPIKEQDNKIKKIKNILGLSAKTLDGILKGVEINKERNPYICYAASPRHFMIRANGRVGKCTVAFNDDLNDLGKINQDGSMDLNGEKIEIWSRGFIDLDEKALACPAHGAPKLKIKNIIETVAIV